MGTTSELLAAAMAGQDISDESGVGSWQVSHEPMQPSNHPDGEVMVGRSVRMPLATFERIRAMAEGRRVSVSRLIREWIDDGLDQAETGEQRDPVVELQRTIDSATRALRALESQRAA
jgi:hypothetical protein